LVTRIGGCGMRSPHIQPVRVDPWGECRDKGKPLRKKNGYLCHDCHGKRVKHSLANEITKMGASRHDKH
ncbi:hypothetical protein, partial [Tetzosporium hominis]|uniref:hypothetical protein n=1 Tax=Tetzosporium hominis TaxID=2020506 RepID=UPI001A9C380C